MLKKFISAAAAVAVLGCAAAYGAHGTEPSFADESCFILREYGDTMALFEEGEDAPIAVYSTPITQINPADAALLADGIRLKTMSEVARLLEDLEVE
ncbi:MAG: hypothetical protein K2O14_09080 [Oscillospiraceae bacterium]|nr:hypothetical protein [Oscillospiraceae bacterium]